MDLTVWQTLQTRLEIIGATVSTGQKHSLTSPQMPERDLKSHLLDRSSITAPLPDILPAPESPKLLTPIALGPLNGGSSVQQDFGPYSLLSGSISVDDEVSIQDLTLL